MSSTSSQKSLLRGGEFLIAETEPAHIFTREDVDETGREVAAAIRVFFEKEVAARDEQIEALDEATIRALMLKAGEIGLLGLEVPVSMGGFGMSKTTALLAGEAHVCQFSFAGCAGVHTSVGMIPIVYFGTEAQRAKYLPKLLSGEWIAAYCLTEPHCGSDAMAIKTTATLSPDGTYYTINGSKMWITNAAFANLFNVAAKVDGKFTMFIVEADSEGISLGAEEKKMGVSGSSTRPVYFDNVRVPVENVLGEVGKGHYIAFNALNMGRLGIGALACAQIKRSIQLSVKYAKSRRAFGRSIAEFGLIQAKLAEMAVRAYAVESMAFRTAGMIDARLAGLDPASDSYLELTRDALKEYAIESSILKVYGSEAQGYAVDEAVQIFGGNGYSKEYAVERDYRNARPTRIFEGTNEINRLLIVETLIKRAMEGVLPIVEVGEKVMSDAYSTGKLQKVEPANSRIEPFSAEIALVQNMKKAVIMLLGLAVQKWMMELAEQQEIVAAISDLIIDTYASESVLLRTLKKAERDSREYLMQVFINDAAARMETGAKYILAATCTENEFAATLQALQKLLKWKPINTFEMRRSIARRIIETESYAWS